MNMNIKDLKNLVREVLLEQTREQQYQSINAKIERIKDQIRNFGLDPERDRASLDPNESYYDHVRQLFEKMDDLEIEAQKQNPYQAKPSKSERERSGTHTGNRSDRIAKAMAKKGNAPAVATVAENKNASLKSILKELYEQGESQQKSNLVFLIGPPAVGKTEYIKSNLQGYEIVNRDDLVTAVAKESGVGTYDDMYARPPQELKAQAGAPPEKDIVASYDTDPNAKKAVDEYLEKIKNIASGVEESPKYGPIKPFSLEDLKQVVVQFGVPTKFINPFVWQKVEDANKTVGQKLADTRNKAVGGKNENRKNMAIDMVSMSLNERNKHREDILKALGENPSDLAAVNKHYNQVAIVFAPESGYTPELIDQIKKVAVMRQQDIAASGGSKTIPPEAYDRMFASYTPPTTAEGFAEIKFVGVPSLARLNAQPQEAPAPAASIQEGFTSARWQRLANIIKG